MRIQILTILIFFVATIANAYSPNTKWPYLNENFAEGTVYRGKEHSVAKFNIHLVDNVLHYINPDDDKIYTAKYSEIDSVVISGTTYVQCDGKIMQVMAKSSAGMVLRYDYADFDALFTQIGAYGTSLNTGSGRNLSSLELAGLNNQRHGLMLQEKHDGKEIGMRKKYFLRIGKIDIEANKKDVEKILPADSKESWKLFLKNNKIKWKKPESLLLVVDFFKD